MNTVSERLDTASQQILALNVQMHDLVLENDRLRQLNQAYDKIGNLITTFARFIEGLPNMTPEQKTTVNNIASNVRVTAHTARSSDHRFEETKQSLRI